MYKINEAIRFQTINLKNSCKEYKTYLKYYNNFKGVFPWVTKEKLEENLQKHLKDIKYFVKRIEVLKNERFENELKTKLQKVLHNAEKDGIIEKGK